MSKCCLCGGMRGTMKHILIVDDNKTSLAVAGSVLREEYEVTPVTTGAAALEFLENDSCDLILLDITMPEMDGFEVMKRIKSNERCAGIPIIFLTADNDAKTESRCLEEGALDFITKPFAPMVMLSRISRILELEEMRHGLANKLEQKIQEVSDMKSRSQQDALTGLWNRAYTEEAVNLLLKQGDTGALLMIDMDNFKVVNDTYGHIAGDDILKMFAGTMRKYAKDGDVLCRIGGDEFLMFISGDVTKTGLSNLAMNLISDICKKIEDCEFEINTSVSVGIAQAPDDGMEFGTLYNAADKALYYVKQNGKSTFHFFSEQKERENTRAGSLVDLKYIRDFMLRSDSGRGAYRLDFESLHHVYNFIHRFVERSNHNVLVLLFTAYSADDTDIQ